jgi:hypothetical protein
LRQGAGTCTHILISWFFKSNKLPLVLEFNLFGQMNMKYILVVFFKFILAPNTTLLNTSKQMSLDKFKIQVQTFTKRFILFQMFKRENDLMYEDFVSLKDTVQQIETKVVRIAELQEIFTEKVFFYFCLLLFFWPSLA